ncbi:hypothetical protein NDN08_003677 [Rhodosorus marinus]|uniref:Uncharacterized protein n=1 Tax=Rhodosorus marinus TaxID=101924 RepID=A0AAV8V351_9RHOD|nr:hypothetical protein NDN08_003677 [Rhodosorus marinus]
MLKDAAGGCNLFQKLKMERPAAADLINLFFPVKAVNDSVGPDGLVPSLMVYGTLPKLIVEPGVSQDLDGRVRSMEATRREFARITAQLKLKIATRHRLPHPVDELDSNVPVLVSRDTVAGRANEWTSPLV